MANFDPEITSIPNFANALKVWQLSPTLRGFINRPNARFQLMDGRGAKTVKVGDQVVISLGKDDLNDALNAGTDIAYKTYGAYTIGHELGHGFRAGGYYDPGFGTSPMQYSEISNRAESAAVTQSFIIGKEFGVSFGDPSVDSQLNSYWLANGNSPTSQFWAQASLYLQPRVPNFVVPSANNLRLGDYNRIQWALSTAQVDLTRVIWSSVSVGAGSNFSISGTDSNWSFSITGLATKGGGNLNLSGSVTTDAQRQVDAIFQESGSVNGTPFSPITVRIEDGKYAPGTGRVSTPLVTLNAPGKTIASISAADSNGNAVVTYSDASTVVAHVQPSASDEAYAGAARLFGSTLGRLIGGSDLALGTASGAILGAAALSFGQRVFKTGYFPKLRTGGDVTSGANSVWADFGNNLGSFGVSAGIGSVSSYLAAEFGQAVGLDGIVGQTFSTVAGSLLQSVATNAAADLLHIGQGASVGGALVQGLAGFVGTKLASFVVTPHTTAEATLASLGAAVGSFAAVAIGNAFLHSLFLGSLSGGPLGAAIAIGAFVGFILGDLIGGLFGHHKPRVPSAMAETVLQIPYAQYGLGQQSSANGGSLDFANAMAQTARDTLNGIIAQIAGSPTASFVSNSASPTQVYGYSGNNIFVKLGGTSATAQNVTSADLAVDKGVLWALPQTKIIGGDIILKRAISNGAWTSVTGLLGDLQIASDYKTYLKSAPVIDAAIGTAWNSLSAADQAYYAANRALITRCIAGDQLANPQDTAVYNANAAQINRIVAAARWTGQVSTFAAGWITTIARANELKLDQFGPSDFYGGLQGFLQSFGIASTGAAVHYEDASIQMVNNDLQIGISGSSASGTFSLLPQASADGSSIRIANFASAIGYHIGSPTGSTAGNDLISPVTSFPLVNPSFEDSNLNIGGYTGGISGWTTAGVVGTFYPTGELTPTDGTTIATMNPQFGFNSIYQQGASSMIAGQTYTFSVDLGVRNDVNTYGLANVMLSSDVQNLASNYSPMFLPWGKMHTATVSYTATSADAGHPLFVTVQANGSNQFGIDNARLSMTTATVIPLANPSFEDLALVDGTSYGGYITGWSGRGTFGTVDLTSQIAATDGENVVYLNPQLDPNTSIWQQAGTLTTGRTYQFSVDVGLRNDKVNSATATVMLSTNAVNLWANTVDITAPRGTMQRISVSYTATAADNGAPLFVTVSAASSEQVEVDNARVISTPGEYTPATSTGDDIVLGGAGNDTLYAGSGNVWVSGGEGGDAIYGGAGRDVLLGEEGNDVVTAGSGNTYLSGGGGLDVLNGGSGNDTLVGGNDVDVLYGNDGNDMFIADADGGQTGDTYNGGNGSDTVSYERFTASVSMDMWNGQGSGYTSQYYGDGLIAIENISGTNYNDVLYGNDSGNVLKGLSGDDIIAGRPGDDILEGGAGADYLNGDAGNNTASYEGSSAGVYVDLYNGVAIGGDATGDVFYNIQNLTGSAYADELHGGLYSDLVKSGLGDDWLDGTRANVVQTLDGGDGFDTLDYSACQFVASGATAAVSVVISATGGTVAYRDNDGYQSTQNLISIESVIGTQSNDVFQSTGSVNLTWDGGASHDVYYGGTGSDTYVFGRGYGYDEITDNNSSTNVVRFNSGLTFNDLILYNDATGGLHFGIRGTSDELYVHNDWNPTIGNDVIKTLDLGGVAQIDMTQIDGTVVGSDNNDVQAGSTSLSVTFWGYGGNDQIAAAGGTYASGGNYSTLGSVIAAGADYDEIATSVGDDQFLYERGGWYDIIKDGGGQNTITFGSTVAADDVMYKVLGDDLWIGVRDLNNPTLDATQVYDHIQIINGGIQYLDQATGAATFATTFSVQAGGTTTALIHANIAWSVHAYWSGGFYYPIVLDLNDDGLQITSISQSDIVTKDAAGNVLRTGWVGPTNGILAFDRNGDGNISNTEDISFRKDKEGAKTDLEGLAGWDTNSDGTLDAKDENFAKLVVWVDANQDGRAGRGETKTLAEAGLASIALKPNPTGFDQSDSIDSVVLNTTTFTRSDGTTGNGYDVAFARQLLTGPDATDEVKSIDTNATSQIGRLENDPVAELAAVQSRGQAGAANTTASKLAVVDLSDSEKSINAAAAERWADYLDPAKIAARKAFETTHMLGAENIAALKAYNPNADAADVLAGRATHTKAARLQTLVIDFSHDGADLIDPKLSRAVIDTNRDGIVEQIGWVKPSDGLLAFDRNGDGLVDPTTELSFLGDAPNARTGFQGLAAFDSSGDGVLNASDKAFSQFLIWRDQDGNGASRTGEVQTLDQAAITQIDLAGKVNPDRGEANSNDVLGVSSVTFADGSTRALYNVALGYADAADEKSSKEAQANAVSDVSAADAEAAPTAGSQIQAAPELAAGSSSSPVATARASLDGPSSSIVYATQVESSDPQWWRNASMVGSTLASLATPLRDNDRSLGANLGSPVGAPGGVDAAGLQRLALLRQSMASLQGASGGTVAIWLRDSANDASPSLAASQTTIPLQSAGIGG